MINKIVAKACKFLHTLTNTPPPKVAPNIITKPVGTKITQEIAAIK